MARHLKRHPSAGTYGNAVQHACWNALLSRCADKKGAKAFTDAHEDFPKNVPGFKAMGLHNRAVGRAAFALSKKVLGREATQGELLDRIRNLPSKFVDTAAITDPKKYQAILQGEKGRMYIRRAVDTNVPKGP